MREKNPFFFEYSPKSLREDLETLKNNYRENFEVLIKKRYSGKFLKKMLEEGEPIFEKNERAVLGIFKENLSKIENLFFGEEKQKVEKACFDFLSRYPEWQLKNVEKNIPIVEYFLEKGISDFMPLEMRLKFLEKEVRRALYELLEEEKEVFSVEDLQERVETIAQEREAQIRDFMKKNIRK